MNNDYTYTYRHRINYAFKNLESIVYSIKQTKICRLDQIIKFEKNINNILPRHNCEDEIVFYKVIRELYTNDRDCFIQLIMKNRYDDRNKTKSLILLTDYKVIRDYFDISNYIFISWNNKTHKFLVDVPRFFEKKKNIIKTKPTLLTKPEPEPEPEPKLEQELEQELEPEPIADINVKQEDKEEITYTNKISSIDLDEAWS